MMMTLECYTLKYLSYLNLLRKRFVNWNIYSYHANENMRKIFLKIKLEMTKLSSPINSFWRKFRIHWTIGDIMLTLYITVFQWFCTKRLFSQLTSTFYEQRFIRNKSLNIMKIIMKTTPTEYRTRYIFIYFKFSYL